MTLPTVSIAIDIEAPDAAEFSSATVAFKLSGADSDTTTGQVVPAHVVTADLDAAGEGTVDLWPVDNGHRGRLYTVTLYGRTADDDKIRSYDLGRIQPLAANEGETLGALLEAGGAIVDAAYYSVITETQYNEIMDAAESVDDLAALDARLDTAEADIADLQTVGAAGAQYTSGGPVACATTANITLSGEQTIDGVTTSASRVLVKDQTATEENGLYVSATGAWSRATDMDAADEVQATAVYVSDGTAQGGMAFATYSAVTTLGTDAIDFVQIGANGGVQGQIDWIDEAVADATSLGIGKSVTTYDLTGYTDYDAEYGNAGLGTQLPAQGTDFLFSRVTVYGGVNGSGIMRGYLCDPATSSTHVPASDDTLLFEHPITWTSDVEERVEDLDDLYTVPAGKELHILWVGRAVGNVQIARSTTDPDGNRPLLRLASTGSGDETGIWSETWYDASTGYWTVPPKLELASATIAAEPFFTIPDIVHAVEGIELCLQYDSIASALSTGLTGFTGYTCTITGSKGKNWGRFWSHTPVSGDVGDHAMTATIWDAAGNFVTSRPFILRVLSASAPASATNVLMVGDSLTAAGTITTTVQENFSALGATVPTFVGTRGTAPANHEGYGGRRFLDFATAGSDVYRLTVSGVTSVAPDDVYSTGGVEYTVSEVNISGGSGDILVTGASAPASSGTLTLVSGSGDASISYSAMATENTNPFWYGGAIDIGAYRSAHGISSVIDAVTFGLGINDMGLDGGDKSDSEIAAIVGYAEDLADAFLADNAACKIVIALPSLCGNTDDGFAANYGAVTGRPTYESGIFRLRKAMIEAFDRGAYHANVSVGAAGLTVDRYYGYGRASTAVSDRITDTTERHTNAVHPSAAGYQQMGDAFFADLVAAL